MLRRTLSSLTSESKILSDDQENELSFDPTSLPTPSPNRFKYEGKFVKSREDRRPLGEKTNKLNKNSGDGNKNDNFEGTAKDNSLDKKKAKEGKEKKVSDSNSSSSNNSVSTISNTNHLDSNFNDIFHLNGNSNTTKIEELTLALSETLKENEQLHDTVSLLKAEIDRLNEDLLEYKEYAELYLLGKELIENQAEEIENHMKNLIKRD